MTKFDLKRLENLLEIAEEDKTPLRENEIDFLNSLDEKFKHRDLSEKQQDWFDSLVEKHLEQ